jgi:hypothetical protein
MFRNSILLASHGKPHVAMTLVQSVRGTFTIAGFPLSAWAFALRSKIQTWSHMASAARARRDCSQTFTIVG